MIVELIKAFYFEASHTNPTGGENAARLHGHSYKVELVVEGEVDPVMGWVQDFGEIKAHFKPLYDALDHHNLNEVDGLDDVTVPGLRAWIFDGLKPAVPYLKDVRITILGDCAFVPVALPPDPAAALPARLAFTFEATHFLPQVAEEHQCHRLHGHSFRIEIGAEGVGLADALQELYDLLDHRCLNDIAGLENMTSEHLSRWVWGRLRDRALTPTVVVVQETVSARCIYHGE